MSVAMSSPDTAAKAAFAKGGAAAKAAADARRDCSGGAGPSVASANDEAGFGVVLLTKWAKWAKSAKWTKWCK